VPVVEATVGKGPHADAKVMFSVALCFKHRAVPAVVVLWPLHEFQLAI
jgi:hypothetical protein